MRDFLVVVFVIFATVDAVSFMVLLPGRPAFRLAFRWIYCHYSIERGVGKTQNSFCH